MTVHDDDCFADLAMFRDAPVPEAGPALRELFASVATIPAVEPARRLPVYKRILTGLPSKVAAGALGALLAGTVGAGALTGTFVLTSDDDDLAVLCVEEAAFEVEPVADDDVSADADAGEASTDESESEEPADPGDAAAVDADAGDPADADADAPEADADADGDADAGADAAGSDADADADADATDGDAADPAAADSTDADDEGDEPADEECGEDDGDAADADEDASDDEPAVEAAEESDEPAVEATTDPAAVPVPTSQSEAAQTHAFDEACGNHGAYVSHFAHTGEEPECATAARAGTVPAEAAPAPEATAKADARSEHKAAKADARSAHKSSRSDKGGR